MPDTITPETQHRDFLEAVELLGGQRAAARALHMSERSLRYLIAGERRLHAGILEDLATALAAHADECRALERRLTPAFAANLTETQRSRPIGHNAAHLRARRED